MRTRPNHGTECTYPRAVERLASAGRRLGFRPGRVTRGFSEELALAGLRLDPGSVAIAAKSAALIVFGVVTAAALLAGALSRHWLLFLLPPVAAAGSLLAHILIMSYPARAGSRLMREVLRGSMSGTNLMIMSLRQEQSLPSAIVFASKGDGAFQRELRRCIWEVVMAKHAGFEEAVQSLGDRFAKHCSEFKSSMDALVTASCEATPEGQRRALDRANSAMVAGAKRRIEEYALSLSTPSMVMFGVGILLPLMVGSFLPMLSWDLWSTGDGIQEAGALGELRITPETVFVMNILFPAMALLVALSAMSKHPFLSTRNRPERIVRWREVAGVIAATSAGVIASVRLLDGVLEAFGLLGSAAAPVGIWLASKRPGDERGHRSGPAVESALFRTGAKMAEGKNFEKAFAESAAEAKGKPGMLLRRLCLRNVISFGDPLAPTPRVTSEAVARNSLEALDVVRAASTKDERTAGMLAMDLAAYLKDLNDLDTALRMRLRPIVSMMTMTAYALAPVVLGVTFAIYVSLASMAGVAADAGSAGPFLLVLGIFLAETNAAVMYFAWAIEGVMDHRQLMASVGQCILCSQMVYAATAYIVSG